MRVVIIGGTGHIGTYLVPRLVRNGHEVIVITRGQSQPYQPHPTWQEVRRVTLDRTTAEADGSFGPTIRSLKPDVVMDLLCFTPESAHHLVDSLRGSIQLLVHCGTVWVRGYGSEVPAAEDHPRNPLTEYGRKKNQIEAWLLEQSRIHGFPASVLHPGHIVGPGWVPVGPTACHDPAAIGRLLRGEEVVLPHLGMETLHHVHADDVAQAFEKTMSHWRNAVGESFFVVSPAALTLRGFAESLAARFQVQPRLRFAPLDEWLQTIPDEFHESALAHIHHSSNCSIEKARKGLDYQPRFSSLDAVEESVRWLIEHGQISV